MNDTNEKRNLGILSNVTVDMIVAKMRRKYNIYTPGGFDAWIPEVLNPDSELYKRNLDAVFILLDGTESREWKNADEALEKINLWEQGIHKILEKITNIPVFINTLDIRMNRILSMSELNLSHAIEEEWDKKILNLTEKYNNCFIYDLREAITDIGRNNFYSDKMWYVGSMPFSREGIARIAEDIDSLLIRFHSAAKKCIVLDLDNTLWGGVIGEDGIDGIVLSDHKAGQRFYDFQKQLYEMKKRGVLLAINSKNNVDDVKKVFEEHPYMLLKWDDFADKKINWQTKAQNTKELEKELNLTESSFVFIDDNPVEREIVAGECPEVTVLDFPQDTTELIAFAENFYNTFFKQQRVLDEDRHKTEMYLAEEKRKSEMTSSLNLDDYISRLEMEADIHLMTESERGRVVQLINKTNQFNLTTKRYTESELTELEKDSGVQIYTVHSSDKYGDAGLISVLIVREKDKDASIDTFLMSCRVMSRKLENVITNEIFDNLRGKGIIAVSAEYIPTKKNAPVKDLYEKLGFSIISDSQGHKKYKLNLKEWIKPEIKTYKTVKFSSERENGN